MPGNGLQARLAFEYLQGAEMTRYASVMTVGRCAWCAGSGGVRCDFDDEVGVEGGHDALEQRDRRYHAACSWLHLAVGRLMRGAVLGLAPLLDVEFQDGPPRAVGEVAAIVSDPDDPARVRFLPPHLASDGN